MLYLLKINVKKAFTNMYLFIYLLNSVSVSFRSSSCVFETPCLKCWCVQTVMTNPLCVSVLVSALSVPAGEARHFPIMRSFMLKLL